MGGDWYLDMGLEVCLDFPFLLLVVLVVRQTPQAVAYNLHIICVHFILFQHSPDIRARSSSHVTTLCVGCSFYDGRGSAYQQLIDSSISIQTSKDYLSMDKSLSV